MDTQSFCLKIDNTANIGSTLEVAISKKFSGLITSLVNSKRKSNLLENNDQNNYLARSPLTLPAYNYTNHIIPSIRITSDLDSTNEEVRKNYELKLIHEIEFAKHVRPSGQHYIQASCAPETLGKFLVSQLHKAFSSFVVEIKLCSYDNYTRLFREDKKDENDDDEEDPWKYWHLVHKSSNYHSQIEAAVVLTSDVPENELKTFRWIGEPVTMLVIPSSSFLLNKSNYPVLSKKQQEIVKLFIQYQKCPVVIEPKSLNDQRIQNYQEYISFIIKGLNTREEETSDVLQYPLQPLHDNLDYGTYETFERDPAKYILYQRAIESALIDMIPEEEIESKESIILLVGAGRGPLIRASLNASANTKRKVKIIAVEKNPIAVVTLKCLIRDLWPDKDIELIAKDMRTIELKERADILVSELLGSFGDNELSPECLDGVQHLLKSTGISIPGNSKSHIQPIMTKKIYHSIISRLSTDEKRFRESTETNWLIYLTNFFHIDNPKELFTFTHPNNDVPIDNSRYGKLTFEASLDCVLHGFSGYFTSQLYKDIEISIEPNTHTKGMASWYSAYFPIAYPMELKQGDKIELEFWRKVDSKKVWYEWKVNAPQETIIHNKDGEIHPIYLS